MLEDFGSYISRRDVLKTGAVVTSFNPELLIKSAEKAAIAELPYVKSLADLSKSIEVSNLQIISAVVQLFTAEPKELNIYPQREGQFSKSYSRILTFGKKDIDLILDQQFYDSQLHSSQVRLFIHDRDIYEPILNFVIDQNDAEGLFDHYNFIANLYEKSDAESDFDFEKLELQLLADGFYAFDTSDRQAVARLIWEGLVNSNDSQYLDHFFGSYPKLVSIEQRCWSVINQLRINELESHLNTDSNSADFDDLSDHVLSDESVATESKLSRHYHLSRRHFLQGRLYKIFEEVK